MKNTQLTAMILQHLYDGDMFAIEIGEDLIAVRIHPKFNKEICYTIIVCTLDNVTYELYGIDCFIGQLQQHAFWDDDVEIDWSKIKEAKHKLQQQ
jgi:hypothetical protein